MPKSNQDSKLETRLSQNDFSRLAIMANEQGLTKSEIARIAIRLHLDNYEKKKSEPWQTEFTQALNSMTNRICGMLARQGGHIGTLYELAWQNHVDNNIEQRFIAAADTVKQKMRKRLTEDERILAEKIRKVVNDSSTS